jgi:glycosyltransferase involved in cell wall biosynthesis
MKLSIVTINYNNADGLRKTIESVLNQTSQEFEYIVVDGNSRDSSIEVIQQFNNSTIQHFSYISEPDNGIYHAMNKGIKLAKGEYVQFLNSGDILAAKDVVEKMLFLLRTQNSELRTIDILYGNMLKPLPKRIICDRGFAGRVPTMLDFYTGTLNHSPAYIKRSLFETYGLYDESLRIVSDWKWYLQVIALNGIVLVYKDIDVTIFDMNGISNTHSIQEKQERKNVLEELLPHSILLDYDLYSDDIDRSIRINRYKIIRSFVWFVDRVLFKLEKIKNK